MARPSTSAAHTAWRRAASTYRSSAASMPRPPPMSTMRCSRMRCAAPTTSIQPPYLFSASALLLAPPRKANFSQRPTIAFASDRHQLGLSQAANIANTATAMTAVAAPPTIRSGSGKTNPPIVFGRLATITVIAMTGATTTPFRTALQ
ncbi:putative antifreeze glycoprotein (plasmid) [Phenylobacterium zucineum HLK1]|uniref:Putative antifreeze glycoprotein n=1 Tax=Phenylobacterium zucineum (strain HLK1) TaxID=450851 RepID=B4RIE8_PHEZH|nr:putative antifreeze glycoprotein [Phenylobacterium zucineum HLK1]